MREAWSAWGQGSSVIYLLDDFFFFFKDFCLVSNKLRFANIYNIILALYPEINSDHAWSLTLVFRVPHNLVEVLESDRPGFKS